MNTTDNLIKFATEQLTDSFRVMESSNQKKSQYDGDMTPEADAACRQLVADFNQAFGRNQAVYAMLDLMLGTERADAIMDAAEAAAK